MPIIRLVFVLVFIAVLVLLAAYFLTKNPRYLQLIKHILKYAGLLLLIALLLFLVARVIRL